MDNLIKSYIEELTQINTLEQYIVCISKLNQSLNSEHYTLDFIKMVRAKTGYTINKFSNESTRESMMKSKQNLILCLEDTLRKDLKAELTKQTCLNEYLNNFYLFLEAFLEIRPHKKSTLDLETLQDIQIRNEYDLQHLLYAVLKPLCMDARVEVVEDTGCGTVRSDIKIPSLETVIETKCTRRNMTLKKLTEEIEADIVHYKAAYIYFYIYDKEKIVNNRQAFEMAYNKKFDGKHVSVIVLQPIKM